MRIEIINKIEAQENVIDGASSGIGEFFKGTSEWEWWEWLWPAALAGAPAGVIILMLIALWKNR